MCINSLAFVVHKKDNFTYQCVCGGGCVCVGVFIKLDRSVTYHYRRKSYFYSEILSKTGYWLGVCHILLFILFLICHASVILIVGLLLNRCMPTSEHCWMKNSGALWARTSYFLITFITRSQLS